MGKGEVALIGHPRKRPSPPHTEKTVRRRESKKEKRKNILQRPLYIETLNQPLVPYSNGRAYYSEGGEEPGVTQVRLPLPDVVQRHQEVDDVLRGAEVLLLPVPAIQNCNEKRQARKVSFNQNKAKDWREGRHSTHRAGSCPRRSSRAQRPRPSSSAS